MGKRVECEVEECKVENEQGKMVPGVLVTCSRCEHAEEAFGTSEASVKAACAKLRENCPKEEGNY